MAKNCIYCGAMNSDTATVCERCKKALKAAPTFGKQNPQKQINNTMGKKNQQKNVQQSIQSGYGQQQFQKNYKAGNKLSKRIVISVGILAFIAAAVFFLSNFGVNNVNSWESKIEKSENGTEGLEFIQDKGSYVVTGYSGVDAEVLIPNSYQGIPVTKIKSNAFKESNIQSVGIGKNVTIIGAQAFKDATLLKDVYIGSGVEEIEESVFEGCMLLSNVEIAKDSSLDMIHESAFQDCTGLENIDISNCNGLRLIGADAFANCKMLRTLDLHDCKNLEVIDSLAFYDCQSIKKIEIPSSVKEAGEYLFSGWSDSQEVVISGDSSLWKLYRNGMEPTNSFAKNENRTWMLLTKAQIIYKSELSHNLLTREEQYELLKKGIEKILDEKIGQNCSYIELSRDEKQTGKTTMFDQEIHFYQCGFRIRGQNEHNLYKDVYVAEVTASGSEYYTDDWKIEVKDIEHHLSATDALLGKWEVVNAPFEYSVTFTDFDEDNFTLTYNYNYYNDFGGENSVFGYPTVYDKEGEDEVTSIDSSGCLDTDFVDLFLAIDEENLSLYPSGLFGAAVQGDFEMKKVNG